METIKFEGVKTALKQTKDGYSLTLAVHPDDLPQDLMRDFVGARYMVVMVRLGDNEMPMNREAFKKDDDSKLVSIAGMYCRDKEFWDFVYAMSEGEDEIMTEGECAEWMKYHLSIDSRKELKTNDEAKAKFVQLRERFDAWKRS